MIPLESLTSCFQGLIPAWLCTSSADGVPNAAILSHVDYVDARHVALSFQFFNKSKRNVLENPRALVRLYDPDTFQVYALALRFARTETEGPLFESMRLRIEAIASYTGLKGIFKLLGADVYEVLSVTRVEHEVGRALAPALARPTGTEGPLFTMRALQELSDRINRAASLECLLESILETFERIFGFSHSMILLPAEAPDRLELIASRGYPTRGVGSEVGFGEGIVGMVAEARKPIRINGLLRQTIYAAAVGKVAEERGLRARIEKIPLPGLPHPDSQLGIPLLVRDELVGVLCVESETPYRFHEEDRAYLEVLGGYVAIAIQNAQLRERSEDAEEAPPEPAAASTPLTESLRDSNAAASTPLTESLRDSNAAAPAAPLTTSSRDACPEAAPRRRRIEVSYYEEQECLLVDGEYLVRNLPAKILWKLLGEHLSGRQTEFTNRRLRLDKTLQLPAFKDNLESRLILLRRRLDERCPEIRIVPTGRGRFRLDVTCEVALVEAA